MKRKSRFFYGLSMLAIAAMVSCEKVPVEDPNGGNNGGNNGGDDPKDEICTITATLSTVLINSEVGTRVALEEVNDLTAKLLWSKGDKINLYDAEGEAVEYTTSTSGTASKATFTGDAVENPSAWALSTILDTEVNLKDMEVSTTIPSLQTYDPSNEFGIEQGILPMLAQGDEDNEEFEFKTVAGVLAVSLKGSGTVKSIVVNAADGEKISGDVVVSLGDVPAISSVSASSVTLNLGTGVELTETPKLFSVVVAPTPSPLSISIVLSDDSTVDYEMTKVVKRNEVLKFSAQIGEITGPDPDPEPGDPNNLMVNGNFEGSDVPSVTGNSGASTERIVDGSTEPVYGNNTKYMEITNPSVQDAAWKARLTFTFPQALQTGEKYKLTFRACSDNSEMVLNDASLMTTDGQYNTGSANFNVELDQEWKEYELTIDENQGWWNSYKFSGNDYLFGLNFGFIAGKVYLDDVVLTKVEGGGENPNPDPNPDGSLLFNGNFETGEIDSSVDGFASLSTCELVDGSVNPIDGNSSYFLKIYNNGGTENENARINIHFNPALVETDVYELTFRACTDLDEMLINDFGLWQNGGWVTGTQSKPFTLTNKWQEITIKIDKNGWWDPTKFQGTDMLALNFGTFTGATVYVDDVVLAVPEPEVVEPGTEFMSDVAFDNLWVNPDMAGTDGIFIGCPPEFGLVEKGADNAKGVVMKITSKGAVLGPEESHKIQLAIKPGDCGSGFTTFEKGKKYKFSFDLKSDAGTTIYADNALIQDSGYQRLATFAGEDGIVTTTEWQNFEYEIIADDENGLAAGSIICLQFAYYVDTFYIDNISVKQVD